MSATKGRGEKGCSRYYISQEREGRMKVNICGTEYEVEHSTYTSKAPYNRVVGNVAGYIDPYDRKIAIHVWSIDVYKSQKKIVEEMIWYELFCAFAYENLGADIWTDSDVDVNSFELVRTMSIHMEELLEAFYDIKTDINHYIHSHKEKGGEI